MDFISKERDVARPKLRRHIKLSLGLYCIFHDETTYITSIILFEPSICWNELWYEPNGRTILFWIFGLLMSQQCAYYLSVLIQYIHFQPHFFHSISYAWKLWQQMLVYGQQKVCDSFWQFVPVITSLWQFATVCDSRRVTNCLWLSHCQPWLFGAYYKYLLSMHFVVSIL